MSATCEKCSGTGMLPGSAYLDCASCDTAMIRVGLETWATEAGMKVHPDDLWAIFTAGQTNAVAAARDYLSSCPDGVWANTVKLKQLSARQTYWNNVAAGLVEVKTAAERAAEDRHHKPHAVYVEQEVAELRAGIKTLLQGYK